MLFRNLRVMSRTLRPCFLQSMVSTNQNQGPELSVLWKIRENFWDNLSVFWYFITKIVHIVPLKLRVQQCVSWKAVVCLCSWLVSVQEEKFLADQRDYLDSTLKSIIAENKREISETERQCLIKKQALLRGINALRREHLHRNRFY